MLNHLGFPAYQKVFRANSAYLFSWQDHGADLYFGQNTPITSHFTLQWELRVMAQEATLEEMAESKLRGILDRN